MIRLVICGKDPINQHPIGLKEPGLVLNPQQIAYYLLIIAY